MDISVGYLHEGNELEEPGTKEAGGEEGKVEPAMA